MRPYLHSLCRRNIGSGIGWYAPVELPEGDQGITYAVPVGKSEKLSNVFSCDIATLVEGTLEWSTYSLQRTQNQFMLKLPQARLFFTERRVFPRYRSIPYKGILDHPDFNMGLVELSVVNPLILEELLFNYRIVVMGCSPQLNYEGFNEFLLPDNRQE